MREATQRDRAIQFALALLLLAPLLAAFWNGGGFSDAFASYGNAESSLSRRTALLRAAGESLRLGITSAAIAALIGIPAAWTLASHRTSVLRTALTLLPLALPAPVAVSGWVRLIAPNATSSFALKSPAAMHSILFSSIGAGLVLGFALWPIVALNAWPGFRRARDASYEAARLYSSPSRAFFRTVLPRCWGEIAAGVTLVFLLASNDFAISSLLLVNTLTVEVHDQAALGKNAAAAWASLPLVVMAAIVCFFLVRKPKGNTTTSDAAPVAGLRCGGGSSSLLYLGVGVGFAIPVLACLFGVLSSGKPLSVSFDAGAGSLGLSVRLAAAAVLLSIGFAVVRLIIWSETQTTAFNAASVFLLAIPGSFLGVSLLSLQIDATQAAPGLRLPLAWMAAGLALRFLYVPFRLTEEALTSLDSSLLESAAVLGHGRIARAFSIALPHSLGYLAAAAALVFTLVLGEVPIASILAPPGAVPATIWLFGQQHMGYDESVFALSLLLGVTTGVVIALGAYAAKWASK